MEIEAPTLKVENGWFTVSSDFSVAGEKKTLWFSAPDKYAAHFLPDRLDAFLVGLLPVAMLHGEDIRLKGEVSEKLLYNVNSSLFSIFDKIDSAFQKITVTADRISNTKDSPKKSGGATGFSGGIDSFCAIEEHLHTPSTPSFQLQHLLFNNVGAISSNVFIEKYKFFKPIVEVLNIDLIPINSNLGSLIETPFRLTHSLRNTACALFLQKLFKHFYYASGYSYEDIKVAPASHIACIDPVALHLLSTEKLDIIASGSQHTRVEKTNIVSQLDLSKTMLNVCIAPNRIDNCSVCWKCCRTLLTLELLGKEQEYIQVFDMKKWKHARSGYISEHVLNPKKNSDPLSTEIKNLAIQKHHIFSKKEKLFAHIAAITPQNIWNKIKNI